MSDGRESGEAPGVATTGHEWDGIRELNNPLPRWWVWTFYATIAWALAYTVVYPAWPLLSRATGGLFGYSSRADLDRTMAAAEAAKAGYADEIAARPIGEILADEKLRTFATAAGAAAFKVNCVQCHGSGAEGSAGYPNLNDDDWLWGGSADAIVQTISHGIRYTADPDTRVSEMPAFGEMLTPQQITDVAAYAAALSGMAADGAAAQAGKQVFLDNCASCHGEDGKGNRELGAPNLADAITLYVKTPQDIVRQITHPRNGVMPAWQARLGEVTVKELAAYVHSLGGGE